MLATPVMSEAMAPRQSSDDSYGQRTPDDLLKQLETLVGTLEDSFTSSEMVMSSSPASPRAMATLKAEKDRRQQLLRQLTQLVAVTGFNSTSDVSSTAGASVEKEGPPSLGKVGGADSLQGECGSAEWKYATLVRLRKFLRRQYRARKNRVVDCVSSAGNPGTDIADERAQLQQLAEDIKSIEFEIRMLSGNKTILQDSKDRLTEPSEHKDELMQSDSARSQRDTVKRMLGSAGSYRGGSASRKADSSGERLEELHECDEGEEEVGDELRGVRKNLLELYSEPLGIPGECAVESTLSAGAAALSVGAASDVGDTSKLRGPLPAVAELPARASAGSTKDNLQAVGECIDAIRLMGEKARTSADAVEGEGRENNTSPCKIARLKWQMATSSTLFLAEGENNSSPSKIDRMRRQQGADDEQQTSAVVPISLVDPTSAPKARVNMGSNHMKPPVRDAWSDVDLARWAAVNRGTICPSPVPVLLPRPASELPRNAGAVAPAPLANPQVAVPETAVVGARRRLDCEMDGAEEAVEAMAAKKFSLLEDKDAARQRASEPGNKRWSVGSDSDGGGGSGTSPEEESLSAHEISAGGEDVLLRTIKKILNGPGSTPMVNRGGSSTSRVVERAQTDSNALNELSLECLAALRSSAFLEDAGDHAAADETAVLLREPDSGGDAGNDACGQARLESRGDSDELGGGDVSDVLLQSVDASGSLLAVAECEPVEDESLAEGTSLLEDFEALPVDSTAEQVPLFQYVFTATPLGEPSTSVRKTLVPEFDRVHCGDDSAPRAVASAALGSTPMGEPSGPVAKALIEMFDQCLSPSPAAALTLPTSPGQAARAEENGSSPLRSVVKRLAFPTETEGGSRPQDCSSQADSGRGAIITPNMQAAPTLVGPPRPMSAALTRATKTTVASRPMSAMTRRAPVASRPASSPADKVGAVQNKTTMHTAAAVVELPAGMANGGGSVGVRRAPTMAWSAPKDDSAPHDLQPQPTAVEDSMANVDGHGGNPGAGRGGLFSAARAQAREIRREGQAGIQRDPQPSVRLAPPIRSPTERGGVSPLALFGNNAGPNPAVPKGCRQRSSSRPPLESSVRPGNIKASRAASVSPNRQMLGSVGLIAAKEPKLQSAVPATSIGVCWPSQQQRSSPSPTSLPPNSIATAGNNGAHGGYAPSVSGTLAARDGRPQQLLLNNKVDLMASVRLARRAQNLATGANGASGHAPLASGARRVSVQEAASLPKTIPTVSAGGVHELKPINCIANTRAPNPDTVSTGGGAHTGLQIGGSGMTLGQVGGKRVVAPKVTGAGVASKQPSRLPPRAAVVCLDDIDVATHRDAQEQPQRSPTEREGELPSLPAPDRHSAAAAGGLSSELMQLLREAAAERLAVYRSQCAGE